MKPAVVILAGGEGRRIGGFKPMCRLGGRTLLDRAIDLARGWSDEVAIAVRTEGQIGDPGIVSLLDPPGLEGPLGGMASALQL
jgi:molybdopterin-guanine dinucleotide biosynthesis protein A